MKKTITTILVLAICVVACYLIMDMTPKDDRAFAGVMADTIKRIEEPMEIVKIDGKAKQLTTPQRARTAPKNDITSIPRRLEAAAKIAQGGDGKVNNVIIKTKEGKKSIADYNHIYGLDLQASVKEILMAEKEGRSAKLKYTDGEYLGNRVEVSLKSQKVYVFKDGKNVFTTPCITGRPKHPTDKGMFRILFMQRNATLKGFEDDGSRYESKVSYWMPFNGGQGLHDANWQYNFGGMSYKTHGSHGCVNLPPSAAKKIYGIIKTGWIVLVY